MNTATQTLPSNGGNGQGGTLPTPPPRPRPEDYVPLAKVTSVAQALNHPELRAKIGHALPRHISPDRMLRVIALACQKTPDLQKCELVTLMGAFLICASLGVEPNTPLGHAYLIPFKRRRKVNNRWQDSYEVQLIIGYRGYIDLARRSGRLVAIHADVVYEGDEFSFEYGSNMHLRHVPRGSREGRQPIWAYCHARLEDGEAFDVLPYDEVLRIRDGSQGYMAALTALEDAEANNEPWRRKAYDTSPWIAHQHEMAAKTMVRRMAKMLPMSIEFAQAAEVDGLSEAGRADFAQALDGPTMEADYERIEDQQSTGTTDPTPQAAQDETPKRQDEKPAASPIVDFTNCDGHTSTWEIAEESGDLINAIVDDLREAASRGEQALTDAWARHNDLIGRLPSAAQRFADLRRTLVAEGGSQAGSAEGEQGGFV